MARERLTTITLEEVLKMKGRTRKDAPEGPSLPDDFWKNAKMVYPEIPKKEPVVKQHLGSLLDLASILCLDLPPIQALGLERPLDMGDARR